MNHVKNPHSMRGAIIVLGGLLGVLLVALIGIRFGWFKFAYESKLVLEVTEESAPSESEVIDAIAAQMELTSSEVLSPGAGVGSEDGAPDALERLLKKIRSESGDESEGEETD